MKGRIYLEVVDSVSGAINHTYEQDNLILDRTFLLVLGFLPPSLFSTCTVAITSDSSPPAQTETTITGLIATGYIPTGATSPVWHPSELPPYGEIINQIDQTSTDRVFSSVSLVSGGFPLTRILLDAPCTQLAFNYVNIKYFIEFPEVPGEGLTQQFNIDYGAYLFGQASPFDPNTNTLNQLSASPFSEPTATYQNLYVGSIFNALLGSFNWMTGERIDSHYKWKESVTWQLNDKVGYIFNSFLFGRTYNGTASAYRISSSSTKNVPAVVGNPVKIPPFQKIFGHNSISTVPFFDSSNFQSGNGKIKLSGDWTNKLPELYKFTIGTGGAVGVATYKFSVRNHLGFSGNTYTDSSVVCPFRNPNAPAATGMHGYRTEDCDPLRFSDTQIVQYDATGVTLLDLMSGDFTNWSIGSAVRQCATDGTNIYVACRNTGLWLISNAATSPVITNPLGSPCYGVDVGRGGVAWAICDSGLFRSTDWATPVSFSFTGITDSNWNRVRFLKADPEDAADKLAIIADTGSGSTYRVVWWDAGSSASVLGVSGYPIRPFPSSLDVSDTGSFWATQGYKLAFGTLAATLLPDAAASQTLNHSVYGSDNYYKVDFYKGNFLAYGSLISSAGSVLNSYTGTGATATTLHLKGGLCVFSDRLREIFSDNTYCWTNYGWNGSSWVEGNTGLRTTHNTDQALINGLQLHFEDGAALPSFVANDFYTQGVCFGTWKSNSETFYHEEAWYSKPAHFTAVAAGNIPSSAPYTVLLPAATDPAFRRIETDSPTLCKIKINGVPVTTIYTAGEPPGINEISLAANGVALFNAADAGKTLSGTYAWIEL
jgi:hypothetical protein